MDEEARRLRKIGSIKEIGFRRRRNETMLPSDLTLAGSEFHTVGATIEKARVPVFVFTRISLEFLAGVSIEFSWLCN